MYTPLKQFGNCFHICGKNVITLRCLITFVVKSYNIEGAWTRRLICVFVVRICHKTEFLITWLNLQLKQ